MRAYIVFVSIVLLGIILMLRPQRRDVSTESSPASSSPVEPQSNETGGFQTGTNETSPLLTQEPTQVDGTHTSTAIPSSPPVSKHRYVPDWLLTVPISSPSARLISVITNQLQHVGPLESEQYDFIDWNDIMDYKMDYARGWGIALMLCAEEHGGALPETLDQALQYYPQELASFLTIFDKNRFELVYTGSLNDLPDPKRTIILRERVPSKLLRSGPSQYWGLTSVYGNGVTESRFADTVDDYSDPVKNDYYAP